MVLVDDMEGCLDVSDEHLPIFYIDAELSFECVVDVDACLHINIASLIIPMGRKADWDALYFLMAVRSSDQGRVALIFE